MLHGTSKVDDDTTPNAENTTSNAFDQCTGKIVQHISSTIINALSAFVRYYGTKRDGTRENACGQESQAHQVPDENAKCTSHDRTAKNAYARVHLNAFTISDIKREEPTQQRTYDTVLNENANMGDTIIAGALLDDRTLRDRYVNYTRALLASLACNDGDHDGALADDINFTNQLTRKRREWARLARS